jgi:tetratricopeptide (TPR) repeat protein
MKTMRRPALHLSAAMLLLGSCASTPPPAPEPPAPPARDRVAELRSLAASTSSAMEVAPLQNPAVDVLLVEAGELEAAGEHAAAAARVEQALALEPDNPRLWQLKAESLLRDELFLDAEKLAMKSYDLGSRIGEWCMRNWLTIAESRDALGDVNTSVAARERAQKCPVQAHQRF